MRPARANPRVPLFVASLILLLALTGCTPAVRGGPYESSPPEVIVPANLERLARAYPGVVDGLRFWAFVESGEDRYLVAYGSDAGRRINFHFLVDHDGAAWARLDARDGGGYRHAELRGLVFERLTADGGVVLALRGLSAIVD